MLTPAEAGTTAASPPALPTSPFPPVAIFASVMGIVGLGLAWRVAAGVLGAPPAIGEAVLAVGALAFAALAAIYLAKTIRAGEIVRAEYADPATSCYFGTITISISLLASAALPYSRALALALWVVAVVGGAGLTIAILGSWILERVSTAKITPAWFIPAVGNATTAYAGVALGCREIAWAGFAFAAICWLTLQPLVFFRFFFAEPLPARAAPSLGILVSSPAVLASALYVLTGASPLFTILVYTALFFAALVVRLWKLTRGMGFSITAWGYTFPAAALAAALIRYHAAVPGTATAILAASGLGIASFVTVLVAALSTRGALRLRKGAALRV